MDFKSKQNVTILSMVTSAVAGGLFLFFSSSEEWFGNTDCINLRSIAHYYGILCLVLAIFTLMIFVAAIVLKDEGCNSGLDLLQLASGIVGAIFLILFFIALSDNEPCGHLRQFTILYFILMCIGFCCCCALTGASLKSQQGDYGQ